MKLGIGIGVGRNAPLLWTPRALFAAGEQGAWYDPSDLSTLFQDSAGTTPVTATGQPVGKMLDKSGRGNHLTFSNATLSISGGLYSIACNGSNTSGVTGSIDFTGTDKITALAAVRKLTDTASGIICELSATSDTNAGSFGIGASTLTGDASRRTYYYSLDGSQAATLSGSVYAAPHTGVLSVAFDIAAADRTTEIKPRVNGAIPSTLSGANNASAGTGNFGNFALYVGRRGGTSAPFNGNIYGMVIRGAASADSQIATAERYLAARAGVTL